MKKQIKNKIILKGNDETDNVREYAYVDGKYEITFNNGKIFKYNSCNVQIIESALNLPESNNCFNYLERIASEVGLKSLSKDGSIFNSLAYSYGQIDFVEPDSLFGAFLGANFTHLVNPRPGSVLDVIYPFGFNVSQKKLLI